MGEASEEKREDHSLMLQLKDHIIQIEVLCLAIIFFVTFLGIQSYIVSAVGLYPFIFILSALLACTPLLVRVTNPPSDLRSRLKWAITGAGLCGGIGAAILAAISLPLGPVGWLAGAVLGAAAGALIGPFMEQLPPPEKPKGLLEGPRMLNEAEAREYLNSKRDDYPTLTLRDIEFATDPSTPREKRIASMKCGFEEKFSTKELDEWLTARRWERVKLS